MKKGTLSQAHARLLLHLSDNDQKKLLERIHYEDLSVRKVEQLLHEQKRKKIDKNSFVKDEEENLKKLLGLDVNISLQKKDAGKITIFFHNLEEYQYFINSLK